MSIQYPNAHIPILGKGSVLLDLFDANGNPTGAFQHLGNCTKFEREIKDDMAELYQSINASPSLIATAVKKRQVKLTIVGTDFSADHGAIFSMSPGKTVLPTTATTFTAEVLCAANIPKKGRFFQTQNPNVDNVSVPPVVKSGSATLTSGTSILNGDYFVVDAAKGIIYIPASSTEVDASALTVTYETLASATFASQVAGATVPFVRGHIKFIPDPTDGQKIQSDLWRVNLSPNGQIGLIADDYGNWTLDGNVLDDTANHPISPYFLDTYY